MNVENLKLHVKREKGAGLVTFLATCDIVFAPKEEGATRWLRLSTLAYYPPLPDISKSKPGFIRSSGTEEKVVTLGFEKIGDAKFIPPGKYAEHGEQMGIHGTVRFEIDEPEPGLAYTAVKNAKGNVLAGVYIPEVRIGDLFERRRLPSHLQAILTLSDSDDPENDETHFSKRVPFSPKLVLPGFSLT